MAMSNGHQVAASPFIDDGYDGLRPDVYDEMEATYPDIDYWVEFCKGAGAILELACGTGRILTRVGDVHSRKVGIDSSAAMIAYAAARLPEATLIKGDFLAEGLLPGLFDRAFIAYNSIYHVLETVHLVRMLSIVRAAMCRGGRFGLDVFNPLLPSNAARLAITDTVPETSFYSACLGSRVTVTKQSRVDLPRQLIYQQRVFHVETAGACGRSYKQNRTLRFFSPQELIHALDSAGFVHVEAYGNYDRSALDMSSAKILLVAENP